MIRPITLGLAAGIALGLGCRVPNPDHCANQDVPGNQFCRELSGSTPYCSPCERRLHGCVRYEPFACEGYERDPDDGDGDADDGDSDGGGSDAGDSVATTTGAATDGPSPPLHP